MVKKAITYIGAIIVTLVSFYYTNMVSMMFKNNDELMSSIKSVASNYEEPVYDASFNGDTMIPGLAGKKVNLNKSYNVMKNIGFLSESDLVMTTVAPAVSINNVYDKYIIQGNENIKSVGLVFLVTDSSFLNSILNILKENEVTATIFVETDFAENNKDLIKKLSIDFEIETLGKNATYNKNNMLYDISLIEVLTKIEPKYCFTKYASSDTLNICSNLNMYTVRPTILTGNYPLTKIKNNIKNGAIISFDMTSVVKKELSVSINYIKQKGYKLETLSNLLSEEEK